MNIAEAAREESAALRETNEMLRAHAAACAAEAAAARQLAEERAAELAALQPGPQVR